MGLFFKKKKRCTAGFLRLRHRLRCSCGKR